MLIKIVLYSILFVAGVHLINVRKIDDNAYFGGKPIKNSCLGNNNKLLSVLNLLCNTTQNTSATTRDACYGCFFRIGNLPPGATMLTSLSQCATMYLVNTTYSGCASTLALVASGIRPTSPPTKGFCYTGYCDFVQCVRKINSNALIDNCVTQTLVGRNFTNLLDRVAFYTNATACILARARCNQFNPITGELQPIQRAYQSNYPSTNYVPIPMSNALQITTGGNLRIVSFPMTVGISNYFCSSETGLDQAAFGDSVC